MLAEKKKIQILHFILSPYTCCSRNIDNLKFYRLQINATRIAHSFRHIIIIIIIIII
jgi:hypothetical protein